jgi:crotonobetainyl-CoA:carnitine CoA-transferase CaiB-like acyl-CoA transferase
MSQPVASSSAARQIWLNAGLAASDLDHLQLPEQRSCLPSSFNVGAAAQASIGCAALAAAALHHARTGPWQQVGVERQAAERECTAYFKVDGVAPAAWEKFSGLYRTRDGHVRIHANFEHHRDGILELLELPGADVAEREDVSNALSSWSALEFETAAAERGLVVAMVRSFDEWDAHAHAVATRELPLVGIRRIGDLPPANTIPDLTPTQRPLAGVRVLDLTRILAGPICGRTLAAYGADVMLVNSPDLPNIASIVDTSRGKRSVHVDLKDAEGRALLANLLSDAHVLVQGYRPGALAALGLDPDTVAKTRPGIVYASLSAYGNEGPWSSRRGFDSLVQTAAGFNHAEAAAAGASNPKTLPVPILDYASGFLMAFGAQAALLKQGELGGSWHVEVSLLQTANWLRSLGRQTDGFEIEPIELDGFLKTFPCTQGKLSGMPHAAEFSMTPAFWQRASAPPGSHAPRW